MSGKARFEASVAVRNGRIVKFEGPTLFELERRTATERHRLAWNAETGWVIMRYIKPLNVWTDGTQQFEARKLIIKTPFGILDWLWNRGR